MAGVSSVWQEDLLAMLEAQIRESSPVDVGRAEYLQISDRVGIAISRPRNSS